MATVSVDISNRLDVICKRGDSFELNLEFGVAMPEHGVDGTFEMKIATSDSVAPETVSITYDSSAGEAANSKLKITSSNTEIGGLTPGLYVYDLQVTDTTGVRFGAGDIKTLLYGTFKVNDDIGA
jgi:hypothetical protein